MLLNLWLSSFIHSFICLPTMRTKEPGTRKRKKTEIEHRPIAHRIFSEQYTDGIMSNINLSTCETETQCGEWINLNWHNLAVESCERVKMELFCYLPKVKLTISIHSGRMQSLWDWRLQTNWLVIFTVQFSCTVYYAIKFITYYNTERSNISISGHNNNNNDNNQPFVRMHSNCFEIYCELQYHFRCYISFMRMQISMLKYPFAKTPWIFDVKSFQGA